MKPQWVPAILHLDHVFQSMHDLVMEDIEAHGGQSHPRHDVNGAEPKSAGRLFLQAGNQVAKSDGRQAHKAKVDAVKKWPFFQSVEH